MRAIEFRAKIINGVIQIPAKYKKLANQLARVIILTEEEEPPVLKQDVKSIQSILSKLHSKKVFGKIEDPVSWQRKIRDEWN